MKLQTIIRFLKTSPLMVPVLAPINAVLWLTDTLAMLTTPVRSSQPTLLIVRLDVLGDYLMFRPYLRTIKASATYRNYRIVLLGNGVVESLAEPFDSDVIDQFLWVDIYKLSTRPLYRYRLVQRLRQIGSTVTFCPTYSRVLVLDDFMARASGAAERIGCMTDYTNIKHWENWYGNRLYTRLIDSGPGIVFEGERNRRITEGFLQLPATLEPPRLEAGYAASIELTRPYVVFSLGAGQEFRVWPAERFAAVATQLQHAFPAYTLVLTGSPSEQLYASNFLSCLPSQKGVLNLTGKLSIPQLVYVLAQARLLISNETGTVHLAAATQTPTIVISQGKSLVRWHPYPVRLAHQVEHLYPAELEQNRHRFHELAPTLNPESPYLITEISTERVIEVAERILRQLTVVA